MTMVGRVAAVVGRGGIADAIARDLRDAGAVVVRPREGEVMRGTFDRAEEYGPLGILVTCPSPPGADGSVSTLDAAGWGAALNETLVWTAEACAAALAHLRRYGYGRIVTLSGRDALGAAGHASTAAAEAAIIGLSRTLAWEAAPYGVTVNCVAPGYVDAGDTFNQLSVDERERLRRLHPGGRFGTPEEVAAAVRFFAADESSFITGQTLYVCGGTSLYSSLSV